MATNITTNYEGKAAAGYVAEAVLAGMTLGGNTGTAPTVTVHEEVPGKLQVRNVDISGAFLVDGTCDFTESGDIDYDETTLDLKELQVNIQDCKDNWLKTWEQKMNRSRRLDEEPPAELGEWIMSRISNKVSGLFENIVWNGDAVNAGEFTGLLTRIDTAKASTPDATGTAITAANVLTALETLLAAVPDSVYSTWLNEDGLRLYIPLNVDKAYQLALGTNAAGSYNDNVTVDRKPLNYQGIPMILAPGLPAGNIIAAKMADLHVGCNLLDDENEVRLLDMTPNDGSRNFRYILRAAMDSNITNAGDITWGQFTT